MYDSKIKVSDLIDDVKAEFDGERNVSDSKYRYWYESLIQLLYSEVIRDIRESTAIITFEDNRAYMKLDDIKVSDERLGNPRVEDIVSVRINGYELSFAGSVDGSELRNSYWFSGDGISIWSDYGSGDVEITVRYVARPNTSTVVATNTFMIPNGNQYATAVVDIEDGDAKSDLYKIRFDIDPRVVPANDVTKIKVYCNGHEERVSDISYDGNFIEFLSIERDLNSAEFSEIDDAIGFLNWANNQNIVISLSGRFTIGSVDSETVPLPYEFVELVKCKLRGEAYKVINDDGVAAKWLAEYDVLLENFKTYIEIHRSKYGR